MQLAVSHLIEKEGVLPKNLQLFGDSAGGNLIWQFLSQALHPHKDLPTYRLPSKLRGVCFMSPWFNAFGQNLDINNQRVHDRYEKDCISPSSVPVWGHKCFSHVPENYRPYFDALHAPTGWLDNIGSISSRWLITAGADEHLSDSISKVYEKQFNIMSKNDADVKFYLQADGIHDDGLMDFMLNDNPERNELSKLVWAWFSDGFQ